MNTKLITLSAAAAVMAFGVTTASAAKPSTTIIGSTGQSNQQAVNSSQSAENGSGGGSGNTYVLGNSAPSVTQTSTNLEVNVQTVGGGSGATTLISPGGCFCQSSEQATNSSQVAANGDGNGSGLTAILGNSKPAVTQTSDNTSLNFQLMGVGSGAFTVIGATGQANQQGTNSGQSAENGDGGSGTFVAGKNEKATADQTSTNFLINVGLLGS